jgi:hypothetical protein
MSQCLRQVTELVEKRRHRVKIYISMLEARIRNQTIRPKSQITDPILSQMEIQNEIEFN